MAYLLLFNSSETLGSVLGCLVESQPSAGLKVLVPDPHDVAEHFRKLFHKTQASCFPSFGACGNLTLYNFASRVKSNLEPKQTCRLARLKSSCPCLILAVEEQSLVG